ncbi:co-chaperone GroES [Patescibacteria group bacterium]|nr:co-chaperone GroES [Patescibacteria group bacterium]
MAKADKKVKDSKLNITPLGDRVVIKPLDGGGKEKRSAAGIIIPLAAQEDKADRGVVVAVGAGKIDDQGRLIPMKVKVGNKVLFQWGDKISIDDEEYYIVSESSILGIIK